MLNLSNNFTVQFVATKSHLPIAIALECFSESLDWEDIQVQDMTISTCNTVCVLVISKSVLIFPSYVIVQPQY